ncbi:unnamed protein product [Ceratitis capitata]|uniref:(Mediterranean fruit fly) hypothetical protein n=1 Tax=Ceratitis capitata TaxID=7213 RepID=A0A811UWI8_CERCA|nr:unnamed protein product [Ceratitis capitata]
MTILYDYKLPLITFFYKTEDSLPDKFKESAQSKYESCPDIYEITQIKMWDQLKMLRLVEVPSPPSRVEPTSEQPNASNVFLQVPPCDTEIFYGVMKNGRLSVTCSQPYTLTTRSSLVPLYHLRYKTQGKAGAIFKQYSLSDDNFDLAWEVLRSRYENNRILVDNQVKILMNLPAIQSENSEKIQRLQTSINNCLCV